MNVMCRIRLIRVRLGADRGWATILRCCRLAVCLHARLASDVSVQRHRAKRDGDCHADSSSIRPGSGDDRKSVEL